MTSPSNFFASLREGGKGAFSSEGESVVAIIKIDRFGELRRHLGYATANTILGQMSDRLVEAIPSASIGRLNRSTIEFAFASEDAIAAKAMLVALADSLEQRLSAGGVEFKLSVKIGAVSLGGGAIDDEAVDLAAAAVADAHQERERVHLLSSTGTRTAPENSMQLLRDLPGAMASGQLQVHYQPKLRTRTNSIEAAEGLLRWDHPTLGPIAIEPFIRMAEETGAIAGLTEWVVGRAIIDRGILEGDGHDIILWINLSGALLPDDHFAAKLLKMAQGSESKIGLEITETAVIGDPDRALANLEAFHTAGLKIAIDDYGSGLSSLAYLKQLPAQELKIDRLFIKELISSHRDPLLVRSSIDLAHALEMEVTAEGVDNAMALALLKVMGCDLVQGYHIAPALPLSELRAFLCDRERIDRLAAPQLNTPWAAAKTGR